MERYRNFSAELPEGWGITQFWDPDDDAQFAFAHEFTKKLGRKNLLAVSWPQNTAGLTAILETIYFQ